MSVWKHLALLGRANSKESIEYILEALWRTRKTGLDAADRQIFREMLQLPNDSDLDPLLVCLRILIRKCVYENSKKDEIQKLFPAEVQPELQRLLTLLLQKFQKEWREDIAKEDTANDRVILPQLRAMTWSRGNEGSEIGDPAAITNLKLRGDEKSSCKENDVQFHLRKGTLETMLKSMYSVRSQLSDDVQISNRS
ncbi:PREDICTED: uncharacterized protein LOC109243714 [Nicotiana attenuata]|uniref:COMM domain-containing protein n=1 Tax=Nicotiana attenuata TaxID=49451 RepID=A0A314L129_NICAT|nr:PREDICTED: uncharacterized protein LOC109243714 [Nicotiana attenuata]XP_019266238.1 PREDICTED: uncharacterized protein LOC109243714 [Nicotiana attenuata]XP_019266239.1 PREDICTED: uncharacterized protein LOC109243714 [Nicotiana attenuata]XP_019266240.1 PREDICTED: uncharacterized protein LOC109243714 [Nicotiana attenuata]XP_019266241.1 PREDICTED: uncharacterized protein LOC109243714 [Nicotiana attenuata]OIT35175.1 hypothetical protein A4A49_23736 [Nicotiana attenuata]